MSKTLDFTKPHTLRSEEEYDAAVARVDELLRGDPEPYSEPDEELHFLSLLIEDYEEDHYPIEPASPQQMIDDALERRGLSRGDLYGVMGGPSRVSEFFSGTRPLSMGQVRGLRAMLGIPADLLITEA